jgi:hypothetical protein
MGTIGSDHHEVVTDGLQEHRNRGLSALNNSLRVRVAIQDNSSTLRVDMFEADACERGLAMSYLVSVAGKPHGCHSPVAKLMDRIAMAKNSWTNTNMADGVSVSNKAK